jgi:REP-associated tyrosine transposase
MVRKPRIEFPGAFYHVISRGNQRQKIFHDNADHLAYLERLEHYRNKYQIILYAYVLMSNHFHFLVETQNAPLSKFMHGLLFTYTQYYNNKYSKVGHLFQGRYKAILCDREAYLLELVRYIHLNPARMIGSVDPFNYPWSSHRAYEGEACEVKIQTSLILDQFGSTRGRARQAYLLFMREGTSMEYDRRYYETFDQRLLGDEHFIDEVDRRTERKSDIEKFMMRVPFSELVDLVSAEHGVDRDLLLGRGKNRKLARARSMLVFLGREWSGITAKELGKRMERDPSVISRLYGRYASSRDFKKESKFIYLLER